MLNKEYVGFDTLRKNLLEQEFRNLLKFSNSYEF